MSALRSITTAAVLLAWSGLAFGQQPASQPRATTLAPTMPSRATAAGQYSTESEAKAHCAGDLVIWANPNSKIYHFAGTRDYGKTKQGAYMCQKESESAGFRAAKNEKPPAR